MLNEARVVSPENGKHIFHILRLHHSCRTEGGDGIKVIYFATNGRQTSLRYIFRCASPHKLRYAAMLATLRSTPRELIHTGLNGV